MHNDNMTNRRRVPDVDQMRAYIARGLTQQEIVEEWLKDSGELVTRSSISMAIARYGLNREPKRPTYADLLPWHVALEHRHKADARLLRLEGRRRAGKKLSDQEATWLENWRRDLKEGDFVVHYERDTEEGFFWVPRAETEAGPDDLVDRSNADKGPDVQKSRGGTISAPRDKHPD